MKNEKGKVNLTKGNRKNEQNNVGELRLQSGCKFIWLI